MVVCPLKRIRGSKYECSITFGYVFYDQEKRDELITWPCALIPVASAINSVSSIPVNQ